MTSRIYLCQSAARTGLDWRIVGNPDGTVSTQRPNAGSDFKNLMLRKYSVKPQRSLLEDSRSDASDASDPAIRPAPKPSRIKLKIVPQFCEMVLTQANRPICGK